VTGVQTCALPISDEELFCIPAQGEGKFFTRQTIKACMRDDIPVVSWSQTDEWAERPDSVREKETNIWLDENVKPLLDALDKDRCSWFGEDFARDQNLTVFWPVQDKANATLRVPFAVELFNMPFRQQEQILFYILDRLPRFTGGAMDARGNGQALAEYAMQKYGSNRIHMIKATDPWYARYFPIYKDALQSQEIEIPASADVMEDHRCVCRVKGIPKIVENQKTEGKKKRHGDSAIAGLMAVYAVNEIAGLYEYAYHPVKKDSRNDDNRPVKVTAGLGRGKGLW
jgi:phage FluMu gp28-like protein